jgi:hypothetical protein
MPGGTDVAASMLAPCDYAALDREGQPVRLRLSSTVLRVENRKDAGADIVYSHGGALRKGGRAPCGDGVLGTAIILSGARPARAAKGRAARSGEGRWSMWGCC